MFYTYVIQSISHGKTYIDQTGNLEDRLKRHNQGRSKYTKPYAPFRLIAAIENDTRAEAVALEEKLKNIKNHERLAGYLEKNYSEFLINEMV